MKTITKKILIALFSLTAALSAAVAAHADYDVFNSTAVEANVTNARIWIGRGRVHTVVVGTAGVTSATLTMYDGASSSNFIRKIATIDTTSVRDMTFDVNISSGLTITTTGTTPAKLSILYKAGQ